MAGINILLVTDDRLWGDAVEFALGEQTLIESVACAATADEALKLVSAQSIDVVVLDVDSDVADVVQLAVRLIAASKRLHVMTLGVHEHDETAIRVIESGGEGCVAKTVPLAELVAAIDSLHAGIPRCDQQVASAVLQRIRELSDDGGLPEESGGVELAEREKQVLTLIRAGLTNKEIARDLRMAVSTAKNDVHKLFQKLQVNSRKDAVRRAIEMDLLGSRSTRAG
ncbi:MAG: response regulator transcription factor [Planctomycetota bacterium]|jgi:DNA-binding NarL/FixJ family response regulator